MAVKTLAAKILSTPTGIPAGGRFDATLGGGSGAELLLAGPVDTHVAGGARDDTLSGGNGADWLVGGAGDDWLAGGSGNDRLLAGSGDDVLLGGAGDDEVDGGAGWDVARFSASVLDYRFDLRGNAGTAGNAGLITQVTDWRGDGGSDAVRKVEALKFADFTVYLDGRNNVPLAVTDVVVIDEDCRYTVQAGELARNDWDFEGDQLAVAELGTASHGTVSLAADGTLSFVPAANYSGPAGFSYTLRDSAGNLATGAVQVDVQAVADAPSLTVDLPAASPAGGFALAARTTLIAERENNDTAGTANVIARDVFSIAPNANLGDDHDPSVTVAGLIASPSDVDHYRFNFKAGERVVFDIDFGKPDVDTQIFLSDSSGRQLAFNDDYGLAHNWVDVGSSSFLDSWLSYQFSADGDYDLMVKPYRAGGDYQLNVSIDDATAVAGPAAPLALNIAAGLVDSDGSESLSITLYGLPSGASLSAGTVDSDGIWHLTSQQLPGLTLMLPAGAPELSLLIDAAATEASNGSTAHHLIGGAGDDRLAGGSEADVMTGGAGRDLFVFDTPARHADTLTDFKSGEDRLWLAPDLYPLTEPGGADVLVQPDGAAVSADSRLIYRYDASAGAGTLYYDADGAASGEALAIARLIGVSSLTAVDFA